MSIFAPLNCHEPLEATYKQTDRTRLLRRTTTGGNVNDKRGKMKEKVINSPDMYMGNPFSPVGGIVGGCIGAAGGAAFGYYECGDNL